MIIIKFKDLPVQERPRERLKMLGVEALSNEELLMIILKSGTKNKSIKDLVVDLLKVCDGINNLKNMNLRKFMDIDGIGEVKATELVAIIELAKRMNAYVMDKDSFSCANPGYIVSYFNYLFKDKYQEEFYVIFLDNKKKYIDKMKLFVGSINYSVVHPREIFKNAYLLSASYIICIHNHPSGDPLPSGEDINLTDKLNDIGKLHGILLIDHLIIGRDCYYSFYENKNVINN